MLWTDVLLRINAAERIPVERESERVGRSEATLAQQNAECGIKRHAPRSAQMSDRRRATEDENV